MGMRGTGSGTVVLKDAFVAEGAVSLRRPRARYHAVYNTIMGCALPLIMSVYVGVAETAAERARAVARKRGVMPQLLGELENSLTAAQLAVDSMTELAADLEFEPSNELSSAMLVRKTLASNAVIATAAKALEVAGGAGYLAATGIERLLRDAYASQFHPLPERKQQEFTGRLQLGPGPGATSGPWRLPCRAPLLLGANTAAAAGSTLRLIHSPRWRDRARRRSPRTSRRPPPRRRCRRCVPSPGRAGPPGSWRW